MRRKFFQTFKIVQFSTTFWLNLILSCRKG